MKLKDLTKDLNIKAAKGDFDVEISGVAYDSRQVKEGDVFVAVPGFKVDGMAFVPDAVKSGAAAVVAQKPVENVSVPQIVVPSSRTALAKISNTFYDFPSRKLKLIGITGTNGKTSICYLLENILRKAGHKVGLISTVEIKINGGHVESKLTTPESLDLQKILDQMVKHDVTHVVMEVSSHSLALDRVLGTEFDIAVFTNLTHDHLDFHGSMEDYLKAKMKLFSSLGKGVKKEVAAILNKDDGHSKPILDLLKGNALTYGINYNANLVAKNIKFDLKGMTFSLATQKEAVPVRTKLIGEASVYNILASVLSALTLGEELIQVVEAVGYFEGAPGRFERIKTGKSFDVVVDFAHSPDGLQKLIETYRPFVKGKLILLFGCPGDRDREKRPIMGGIASKLADHVIISTDDPHSEDPRKIIDEIEDGMCGKTYEKIIDRRQAIEKALSLAKKGDMVLIAGRGHERYQDFGGKKLEIDDRAVVREVLAS